MLDNKNSFNNQQDNIKVNREIHPWLYERFEKRAHPLPKRRPTIGKSTLSTKYHPQFLRLSHSNSRLARRVVNQTNLASRISHAERFISLPPSFGSLIDRKTVAQFSAQNQILDLPWFNPRISNVREPADQITFRSQEKITGDIAGRFDNRMLQLLPESSRKKPVTVDGKMPETYIRHLISPPIARKSAAAIVDNIVSPTPTKGTHARTHQLTEINYSNDSHKVVERKPPLGTRIRPTSSVSHSTTVDRAMPDKLGTRIQPTSLVSHSTAVDKAMTDAHSLQERRHGTTITGPGHVNKFDKLQASRDKKIINETDRQPPNTFSRQPSQPTQPVIMPGIPVQKDIRIKNTSSLENPIDNINRQKTSVKKTVGAKTMPNRQEDRQNQPVGKHESTSPTGAAVHTAFELTAHKNPVTSISDSNKTKPVDSASIKIFKEPTQKSHAIKKPAMQKSGTKLKDDAKKDMNNPDYAMDLLYTKPLSTGRQIVQSPPLSKNISHKIKRPAEAIHITDEQQPEVNINQLPMNNPELIHPHDKASGAKLDNVVITDISGVKEVQIKKPSGITDANSKKPSDLTYISGAKEAKIRKSSGISDANRKKPSDLTYISGAKEAKIKKSSGISDANRKTPVDFTYIPATKEVEIKKSSGISDANSKKTVDFTGIKDFKQPVQDSYHAATPAMNKLDTAAKDSTGKDVSHAYPANDLFYKTSAPIGQRIVRSLTTRRNSSHQGPLSSKVTLSTGQQHPELHDIQLPSDNLEIPQVHKISDDIRKPKAESLLIPQLVSDITQNIIGNKISMSRKPEATHDSTKAVNNTLDLVLTQSNRLPAAQHEGNYPQSDQSTQYTRRAQASLSVQSTQQTQASQASQPAVTQATVTKLPDENMNKNENQPDIRALAREIYPLIRRMIVVERERRPSR